MTPNTSTQNHPIALFNQPDGRSALHKIVDLMLSSEISICQYDLASHFRLDESSPKIQRIVAEHSFENMSDGRSRGQQDEASFIRKGVSGDWQNHFTPELKALYKEMAGDALIEFGYEEDAGW